jgi:hypothetical protein
MRKFIPIFLFFIGWLGCDLDSVPAQQAKMNKPPIRFLTQSLKGSGLEGMDETAEEAGIDLEINGIVALDKNTAFLYGGLRVGAGAIRSVLLRTGNGGRLWSEIMRPKVGNEIWDLAFDPSGFGYALALWTVESPGDLTLFRSHDRGKTWQRVAIIPKKELFEIPLKMCFTDRQNGSVYLNAQEAGNIRIVVTRDGGKNWKESGTIAEEAFKQKYPEKPKSESKGYDGSSWKLTTAESDPEQIIIFGRLPSEKNWRPVAVLPHTYGYHKGQIFFQKIKEGS